MGTEQPTLVAIPALNEQESVAEVVRGVRQAVPDAHIVVVDDSSDDRTAEVSRAAGAEVLSLPFNVGVGGAMRTAFLYALANDFGAVVQLDADGQHEPADIPALLGGLDLASVVIGTRFSEHGDYQVRGPRRWAMRTLALVLSRVAGTSLSDTTSGFRAADRRAIELFARHYPAEYLGDTIESLVIALRAGLPVAQVPVTMHPRRTGSPSQTPLRATLYLGRALLALVVALSRRRPQMRER
ncbi:MAG TPA: glycosyltransferase family 2 protein [Actinomycetota bacterium]|nr:glycosyltransferase family 2 protein [Actinomycetota bacterium]